MGVQKALGLEGEYASKIDKCLTDTFIKVGAGTVVGSLLSLVLFKRKMWPVTLGSGIGAGIAYSNCQTIMRYHYLPDEEKTKTLVQQITPLEPIAPTSFLGQDINEEISQDTTNSQVDESSVSTDQNSDRIE